MKKILDMTPERAKKYFMKNTSYFGLELPKYFDFTDLLKKVDKKIQGKNLTDFYKNAKLMSPDKYDNVNYKFYHNKDGKYAWRMFQLIHPAVYLYLVNMITSEDNWNFIKNKFNDYKQDAKIICCSDLVESSSRDKDKGAIINRWWNELEQNSIKLSLEYEYIGITDIVDCYGSIYTHSIAWALHGRNSAKGNKEDMTLLGNKIDKTIRNMCYGQTNGIPQGSTLMDFIAEIVLGYGDTLISNRLEEENINNYKILRYRDDYRVFSNNRDELNEILKIISEELATLNMRLNTQKTLTSDDVISNSIKRDKLESIDFKYDDDISLQKNLLQIRNFSLQFPNSGRVITLLNNIYKNEIENKENKPFDNRAIISIIIDIMYNNTKSYYVCVAILSKLLSFEKKKDRESIISLIENKFSKIPNTDYLSIWLQRITITYKPKRNYNSIICKKLYKSNIELWNSDWLNFDIDESLIVNEKELKKTTQIVPSEELKIFDEY